MWKPRVATSGTCSGPGRIDVSLGMATQVLPFEFRRPPGVLPKGVRRAVQERVMTLAVEMLQLANQIGLGKIFRTHIRHVVLLWPTDGLAGSLRHTGTGPSTARLGTLCQHAGCQRVSSRSAAMAMADDHAARVAT